MADDINNNEGMDEAGDAGMPDDLKRLLARAEQGCLKLMYSISLFSVNQL